MFNDAVAVKEPGQIKVLDQYLRPALTEALWQINGAFQEVGKISKEAPNYKHFTKTFNQPNIAALRREVENLPFNEALWLHNDLAKIDSTLKAAPEQQNTKQKPPAQKYKKNGAR